MSDAPRPTLKLKLGKRPVPPAEESAPAPAPAPAPEPTPTPTASETPQPQRKLTLKIARKPQPEESEEKPKKKKSTKKRPAENVAQPEPAAAVQQGPKRLKLNPSKKPALQSIRIKNKGVVPNRPVGVGYDSEASDTEADPAIEEQFILRMQPGEDCEALRQAIKDRTVEGNGFGFKPLNREGRRAIFTIKGRQYAAALVDLPCIIEGMKSWDRRGWYKSADICQMLLVLGRVNNEQEALEYPLPPDVQLPDDKTLQYAHGLAPPLRWVRKRRFRDRLSTRTIEQVEKAVEDLLAQDEQSIFPPKFELVDSTSLNRAEGMVQADDYEDEYDEEQDAYGEADEEIMDDFEDTLAAEMEAALAGDDEAPGEREEAPTPSMPQYPSAGGQTDRGDSSGGDSDSDGNEDELDDDQLEEQQQLQQQREEVAELEALIRTETAQWEKVQNHILRNKKGRRIQELKKDLELKKVSMGITDDHDD